MCGGHVRTGPAGGHVPFGERRGGALGLGALANTAAVTNATLEWRYVSSERIGTPYVVLRAKRAIAPGEEWTVGYGSATPLECEMGCPTEDSEEEATDSDAEAEEEGAGGGSARSEDARCNPRGGIDQFHYTEVQRTSAASLVGNEKTNAT